MSAIGHDVELHPRLLARIQRLHPGAIGYGRAEGPRYRLDALLKQMARRGEIEPLWKLKKEIRPGVVVVPYVRYLTPAQVRRRRALLYAGVLSGGLAAALLLGWAVWSARWWLLGGAAVLLLLGSRVPHWSNGCSGLHCEGCRG